MPRRGRRARAGVLAVAGKDLRTLAVSPIPWVAAAVFHLTVGLLYVDQLVGRGQAVVQPLFPIAGFLLLAVAALTTMRSIAEEARSGTLELLTVAGLPAWKLAVGKWLAATVVCWLVVAPALLAVLLVSWWGDPDNGVVIAGFLGLAALAAACCGIGVFASALTSSQPVAAALGFFVTALLWFSTAAGGRVGPISLSERLQSSAAGALDSADLGAFAVVAGVGVVSAGLAVRARFRPALPAVLAVGAAVAVSAVAIWWLDGHRRQADLTQDSNLTLTDETKEVVDGLRGPVSLTALMTRDHSGRAEAASLLQQYRRLDRRIETRIVDPTEIPGELSRFGVEPQIDTLIARRGERVERATTVTEQDITGALARLERSRSAVVCIAQGHGEVAPGDTTVHGLSVLAGLLARNGATIVEPDLLIDPVVPPTCRALVLANPRTDLGPAVDAVRGYLAAGGRALVLADPSSTLDLSPILDPYGLTVDRGIVVEGDAESRLPADPTTVVARSFPSGSPVVRALAPLVVPAAQAAVPRDGPGGVAAPGLSTSTLVRTTQLAYLERDPATFAFDPATDVSGPIPLAAAADQSGVDRPRSRVVLVGDVELATNAVIGQGDNGRFLLQAMDWLAGDDDLVLLNANLPRVRPLAITPGRARYARWLLAGGIPAASLLAGLFVWAFRRSR